MSPSPVDPPSLFPEMVEVDPSLLVVVLCLSPPARGDGTLFRFARSYLPLEGR